MTVPRIKNDLDQAVKTLQFRKLTKLETLSLIEEIRQRRAEIKEMEEVFEEHRQGAARSIEARDQ